MNRRLMTIFLVAAVIAGFCCWGVYRLVSGRMNATKPVATTQVIAAAKDIPLGAVLTTADLTTMTLGGAPPKGAILKQEDAIGRGVITQIAQGEPILDSQLAGIGSGGGLAPTIPKGMRACAVRVDEVVGVAGFVIPGMRVDVLVSGNPPGEGNQGVVTETILQDIQVLSAGTDIQRRRGRQAATSAGSESSGDAGAGPVVEPGGEFAEDSTGTAQSAGYADDEGSGDCDEQPLRHSDPGADT